MPDRARVAVGWSFALNGFAFATWVSRIPQIRSDLALTNTHLGLLVLVVSIGSILALPATGPVVHRLGPAQVVAAGAVADAVGLVLLGVGAGVLHSVPVSIVGLFAYGVGTASWDVAMNVEGAVVEHELGRTVMPRFHAGFSLGTVVGAAVGAALVRGQVPMLVHLAATAALVGVAALAGTRRFLPRGVERTEEPAASGSAMSAWGEPRTLLVGVMMLALALTEGVANDWLALALIDGYDAPRWLAVAGYGLFVVAMTVGRFVGPALLDRWGRLWVMWASMALAAAGIVVLVESGRPALAGVGVLAWGLGTSLGFPVGVSAASDDPARAAARVGVVTSIAYTAFFVGPAVFGPLADRVGTLEALLLLVVILVPSALVVPAARERRP